MASSPEIIIGIASWTICSIGMMLFNKLAVKAFPCECALVGLQMAFSCIVLMMFCYKSIHIGSWRDALRWSLVVPFFSGMLLTSILALKTAPMSLVVVFRCLSPLAGLIIESFYPEPLKVDRYMILSIMVMLVGAYVYASQVSRMAMAGVGWVLLNNVFAVGDRLLQRLMLAKDQSPVDISKTGVTLLNNLEGLIPVMSCALINKELAAIPAAYANLDAWGMTWIVASCVVGVGISYTGIWCQSVISATSFLVLINANKFVIIFMEVFVMHSKSITNVQIVGAMFTILGGVLYGKARERLEQESSRETLKEKEALIARKV